MAFRVYGLFYTFFATNIRIDGHLVLMVFSRLMCKASDIVEIRYYMQYKYCNWKVFHSSYYFFF